MTSVCWASVGLRGSDLAGWDFKYRRAQPGFAPTQEVYKDANTQVHTLRQMVKEKDEAIQRQCNLEKKIHELEKQGSIKIQKKGDGDISITPSLTQELPGGEAMLGGFQAGVLAPCDEVALGMGGLSPLPPPVPSMTGTGTWEPGSDYCL